MLLSHGELPACEWCLAVLRRRRVSIRSSYQTTCLLSVLVRSYSGYGKVGYVFYFLGWTFTQSSFRFDRRFRVFDISEYGETIKTYKRTEKDEIVDRMTLAGAGAAPLS